MSAFEIFAHTAFSSNYERMMGNCSRIVAAELVRIVRITSSSYVLDNACGPGIVSEQVKLLEPSAKILATDFALPMLEETKKRIMAEKWENVETDQMDTRDLSRLADNTFTHVLTNFGAFMPGDKSVTLTAIKEMYRVVQIGGVAILSLWADRVFPSAYVATAREIRPNEEPSKMMLLDPEILKGSWLFKQLEDGGFGNNVDVRTVTTYTSAKSLDLLVENMMLASPMFFPQYSEEELSKARLLLKENVQRLRTFEVLEGGGVRIVMKAWIGVGYKKGDENEIPL